MVLFLLVLCYFNFTFGMSKGEAVQAALNRRMNQIGSADDMNFETSGLSFPSQSKEFMNFEISGISFPSHAKESFRVRSESTAEGLILKLEKKSTKHLWQVNVTDIGNHGLSGIPKETIISIIKRYMEESVLITNGDDESPVIDPTKPVMDLEITKDNCLLILEVPFGGTNITYNFEMLPQAVDQFDRLESLLNDALEDIAELKEENTIMYTIVQSLITEIESVQTNLTRLESMRRHY